MPAVACPTCHESERLSGKRRPDRSLEITCLVCGAVWQRDATPRCSNCGSIDLAYTPRPLWAKGRGEQHTPAGRIDAYTCRACDTQNATASTPREPAAPAVHHHEPTATPAAAPPASAPSRPLAASPLGDQPARLLLPLQDLDDEINRLRHRAEHPPEQRKADATGAQLRNAARTMVALSNEVTRLRQSRVADSETMKKQIADAKEQVAAARNDGEQLAAHYRANLAAITQAQAATRAALEQAQRRREALAAALDPSLTAAYEALRDRVPNPVVPVIDLRNCAGCRVLIPQAEFERARDEARTGLARCPACNRILLADGP